MPIYEYRCTACHTAFSRLQKVGADSSGVRCPSCDNEEVERLPSAFASAPAGTTSGPLPCAGSASCPGSGST